MTKTTPFKPLEQTVIYRLHALSKLTDHVSRYAYEDEIGIPHGEGRCLAAIGSLGPLSVKDLSRAANLDKAQASRSAQALVDKGLISRQPDPDDKRGVVLATTTKGRAMWRKVMVLVDRRNTEIAACLSAKEREQLSLLLERLVDHNRLAYEEFLESSSD
jgi:DNA-binding MarR family transcriptional regulator